MSGALTQQGPPRPKGKGTTTVSEQPATSPGVPEWDVADRLRKALRQADVSVQQMATYLGVTRRSVGNWINGHFPPSTQTLRLWALRTGVPFEWLSTGKIPSSEVEGRLGPKFTPRRLHSIGPLLTAAAA